MNKKWEVTKCHVKKCWCRAIYTKDKLCVIEGGNIGKEDAKYFVKLHNEYLK